MPTRSQLRTLAKLETAERYYAAKSARADVVALNPNIAARMGDRDAGTGKLQLATANGSLSAKLISTGGGIANGGVVPSVTVSKSGNYGDAKPT